MQKQALYIRQESLRDLQEIGEGKHIPIIIMVLVLLISIKHLAHGIKIIRMVVGICSNTEKRAYQAAITLWWLNKPLTELRRG